MSLSQMQEMSLTRIRINRMKKTKKEKLLRAQGGYVNGGKALPKHVGFTQTWGSPHVGRYLKRRLSKQRRVAWKTGKERGLVATESSCNYKNW